MFHQLRSAQCPYFYMCTHQFTVLFRAPRVATETMSALISPTTRGFREALQNEGVYVCVYFLFYYILNFVYFPPLLTVDLNFAIAHWLKNLPIDPLSFFLLCSEDYFSSLQRFSKTLLFLMQSFLTNSFLIVFLSFSL